MIFGVGIVRSFAPFCPIVPRLAQPYLPSCHETHHDDQEYSNNNQATSWQHLLDYDHTFPGFYDAIGPLWGYKVSHFGFLDIYGLEKQEETIHRALTVLRNESLAVLRKLEQLGLSIPTAISFTFKGLYFLPSFTDPSSPRLDEFMLYKKCGNFPMPHYDDPNELCGNPDWTPVLPEMAYSLKRRRTMTYLTMSRIATLACNDKQVHLDLSFGIAAYDVDSDRAAPCKELGFNTQLSTYGRVVKMHELMNFFRDNYTKSSDNTVCKSLFAA
ncbi:hypothetical protein HPB50_010843 [Hyalomma asiaticum]|uniref:Uncharacterized protein n=1 Tax=Hyalomma asiaticum TaxID=266040 RepID=A0ACB7RPD5_HYAAI|nr:hypothetical protein HPB50_010843 [Hyalomma asiaticum]